MGSSVTFGSINCLHGVMQSWKKGTEIFQKSMSHIKFLGAWGVKRSKFRAKYP
jgi:hypothetical protein